MAAPTALKGFVAELDETIAPYRDRLLNHPIWDDIRTGRLPRHRMVELNIQQYYASADSVRKRMTLGLRAPDQETLEELTAYAMGEVGHEQLSRQTCAALGVDLEKLLSWDWVMPEVDAFNDWAWRLALMGTTAEWGASYNYALEGVFSMICDTVAKGLVAHYGLTEEDVQFWSVHVEADTEHQSLGAKLVERLATTPEIQKRCKKAAITVLKHLYNEYDAVYRYEEGAVRNDAVR